jgi:two-component system, chemotaxis family, protein-glutamate methylesterase/glutaminase
MIKVLIVEDSRVVSEYLQFILNNEPGIEVIGNVSNGKEAIEFLSIKKPDVITMDIEMPVMNGLEATKIIMEKCPVPIIIVTGSRNARQVKTSMEALSAGALSIIEKPVGINHPNEAEITSKLIVMVKLMSEIKVITRKPKKNIHPLPVEQTKLRMPVVEKMIDKKIVAVGISSGGPPVLQKIFSKITPKFPFPILVVQHISEGFLQGLVSWLKTTTSIKMVIPEQNEMIFPGNIYFAPDNHHMSVTRTGRIILVERQGKNSVCPSVAFLFANLAKEFGKNSIAMLLTGMGNDGAAELKTLRDAGSVTIAQDKESSLVHGMPGVAIKLDAADYVMNPGEIADILFEIERGSK